MAKTAQLRSGATTALSFAVIAEHPTRMKCWSLLAERTMSPKELAEETGLKLNHVSYHVRRLHEVGVIELVRTEARRGATGHWYRSVVKPDMRAADVEALTPIESRDHAAHIVQMEVADIAASLEADKLVERAEHSLIRFPADLDDVAFAAMSELLDATLEKVYEIQEDCIRRTTDAPEKRDIPTVAHLNLFELPERSKRVTAVPMPNALLE